MKDRERAWTVAEQLGARADDGQDGDRGAGIDHHLTRDFEIQVGLSSGCLLLWASF